MLHRHGWYKLTEIHLPPFPPASSSPFLIEGEELLRFESFWHCLSEMTRHPLGNQLSGAVRIKLLKEGKVPGLVRLLYLNGRAG